MKSTDLGRSWTSIAGNLPERGSVYSLAEDFVDRNLLFAGTEFGAYFTRDGGKRWIKLAGLPTIQVRDMAIQKRENDLVVATFGRGFYVLDDYSALRGLTEVAMAKEAVLFPTRAAPLYVPSSPLGLSDAIGPSFQGSTYYAANNPPYGAVFTYYLKDELKTRRAVRLEAEKELEKKNADVFYPPWDSLRAEDRQESPAVIVTISDPSGKPIRRFTAPVSAGINRVAWDLRLQPTTPVTGPPYASDPDFPFGGPPPAPYVIPGTYSVALSKRVDGVFTKLTDEQKFEVVGVDGPGTRTAATLASQQKAAELTREVFGLNNTINEALQRMPLFKRAIDETPTADTSLQRRVRALETKLIDEQEALNGDPTQAQRQEAAPQSLLGRVGGAIYNGWTQTLEAPTAAQQADLDLVRSKFDAIAAQVRQLIDVDLKSLESDAEKAGVPWTSGRFPKPPTS